MDNLREFRIEEKRDSSIPQDDLPKKPLEERTDVVADKAFHGYQRWSDRQNEELCDLYRLDRKQVQSHLSEDFESQEISENMGISKVEDPKNESLISWGKSGLMSVGSKVVSYGSSFFANSVKDQVSDHKDELVLKPAAKKTYALVLKLVPVGESREWILLLNCLPEPTLGVLHAQLSKLIRASENKIDFFLGNAKLDEEFTDFYSDFTSQFIPLIEPEAFVPKELCKKGKPYLKDVITGFVNELTERIEMPVTQLFTDPLLSAVYPLSLIRHKELSVEGSRYLDSLESSTSSSKKSSDPLKRYLGENDFVEHTPSVFSSVAWEMEFGRDLGGGQHVFEKGYCKISFSMPGVDLKEIRIPIDLRALKLESLAEAQIVFSLIQEAVGKPHEELSAFCSKENLVKILTGNEKVNKKIVDPLIQRCFEDEKVFAEFQKLLMFTNVYVADMMNKMSVSLGREYLHLDGVVTHFEVFPNLLIKELCRANKNFKGAYESFLCALYDVRQQNELNLTTLMQAQVELDLQLNLAVMSKKQKKLIAKYVNYLMGLTFNKNDSNFTQISIAEKTSSTWKDLIGLKEWPEGIDKEIFQLMMDPATCRQVTEFVRYGVLVKEENERLLKEKGSIAGDSFHNMKLQSLSIDLIEKILLRVEPLKKEQLITSVAKVFFAASDPTLSQDELHAIEVPEDLSSLKEMLERWQGEDVLRPTSELNKVNRHMSPFYQLKSLKELFIKKVMDILPHEMPLEAKKEMDLKLNQFLTQITQKEIDGLWEVIKFLDNMKVEKRREIFTHSLPFNFVVRNAEMIKKVDFREILGESNSFLPTNLIFQMLGTPNSQVVFDPYELPIFHPSYIEMKEFSGKRQLYYWDPKIQQKEIEENGKKSVWQKVLVKDRYQQASVDNYAHQQISWHMEEGEVLPETNEKMKDIEIQKKSRVFKSGYAEISVAVPTWGDCRSCRAYLDLSPFELNDLESVQQVLECISIASGKTDPWKAKEELLGFIDSVKDDKSFSSVCQKSGQFIKTGMQFIHAMNRALSKVYLSIGEDDVHFDDVEENGGVIPLHMLEEMFLTHPKMKVVWEDYLKAVGKLRDLRMKEYLLGEKAEPQDLISFEKDLKNACANIIWWVQGGSMAYGVFANKEDQQVVKSYVDKMQTLATEPWDKKNFALKAIEKRVKEIAEMEDIIDDKELLGLRIILFPLLVDAVGLKAFDGWMRALKVARSDSKSEFSVQRLEKKQQALIEAVKNRPDMTQQQKEEIVKWVEKIKSPGK